MAHFTYAQHSLLESCSKPSCVSQTNCNRSSKFAPASTQRLALDKVILIDLTGAVDVIWRNSAYLDSFRPYLLSRRNILIPKPAKSGIKQERSTRIARALCAPMQAALHYIPPTNRQPTRHAYNQAPYHPGPARCERASRLDSAGGRAGERVVCASGSSPSPLCSLSALHCGAAPFLWSPLPQPAWAR